MKEILSQQEIYNTSKTSTTFREKKLTINRAFLKKKYRLDNRTIRCKKCDTYFQPTVQGLISNNVRYRPIEHLKKMLSKKNNIPVLNSFNICCLLFWL
jgi:hypothetical protein